MDHKKGKNNRISPLQATILSSEAAGKETSKTCKGNRRATRAKAATMMMKTLFKCQFYLANTSAN